MANCLAIDYSAATSGSDSYWECVKTILSKQVYDTILFWDTTCTRTTLEIAQQHIKNKCGSNESANPASIIPYLSKVMNLTVITAGQVPSSAVEETNTAIKKYDIFLSIAEIHIIHTNKDSNFLVADPFSRAANRYIHIIKYPRVR